MRVITAAVSCAAVVLAAGCSGSSSSSSGGDDPTIAVPTSSVTSDPSTPSSTPRPTPSPTPSADPVVSPPPMLPSESPAPLGQPACTAGAVSVTDADTLTSPSYRREVFVLRTAGTPCQLEGYPQVVLLDASGRALPVKATHGGSGQPAEKPAPYTLSRATSLSFSVSTARSGTCTQATSLRVTLPGTSSAKKVATDLRVCGTVVGLSPVHRLGDDE
jgi:hypothetical protein